MNNELTKETKEVLNLSNEERIAFISKDEWITYPLVKEILNKMENLLIYEKNKSRINSILLVGASNNGKTSLLKKFEKLHPPYDYNIEGTKPEWIDENYFDKHSGVGRPILYVLAPSEPSETRLYSNILNDINAPFRERDSVSKKQNLVEYYLTIFNVEMLIIDEIHNILSGSVSKQKQIMNAIKNLSNKLMIPIVLSGTKDALRAVNTDYQISSRFRPEYLTKWKLNQEYVSLLATVLTMIPVKKESDIFNTDTASQILKLSDGYIGEIINLLKEAAKYSIITGTEKITIKEINECGYNTLSNVNKTMSLKDI